MAITIGSITFDETKADEWKNSGIISKEGELARLYLELLPQPAFTEEDVDLGTPPITYPAKPGIDLQTATFAELKTFLSVHETDGRLSESTKQLCRKVMAERFPTEFATEKTTVDPQLRQEYALIEAELVKRTTNTAKTDFLGECGGGKLANVRLDGSLDHDKQRRFIRIR